MKEKLFENIGGNQFKAIKEDIQPSDQAIIEAMLKYGGHFVKALATAAMRADSENLRRIKETWPEYWTKYAKFINVNK